ncbi:hypothetical protein BH10BAC4_BH10BAC4_17070 [soil metagenome]
MQIRVFVWLIFSGVFLAFEADSQDPTKYALFQLEGEELFWRNTYEYSDAPDELRYRVVQMLKSKFFTFNVTRNETGYTGEIRYYQVDCKRYGRSSLTTPRMYWEGEWTGKFMVVLLPNQYRVTIYALHYEKLEQSSGYYRTQQPVKGMYINAVTTKKKKGLKKSEFSNLVLMSVSLKDNFDINNTVLPQQR